MSWPGRAPKTLRNKALFSGPVGVFPNSFPSDEQGKCSHDKFSPVCSHRLAPSSADRRAPRSHFLCRCGPGHGVRWGWLRFRCLRPRRGSPGHDDHHVGRRRCSGRRRLDRWGGQSGDDWCRPHEVFRLYAVPWGPRLPQPGHLEQRRFPPHHPSRGRWARPRAHRSSDRPRRIVESTRRRGPRPRTSLRRNKRTT